MKTIRVFGDLAKKLNQRVFRAEVDSAAEAVRFLVANFPWLESYMCDWDYKVFVGTYNLGQENLHEPVSDKEEILICPVVCGAGAVARIIAGVVLIAASIFIPGFAFFGIPITGLLFAVGVSLVLGGVAQLLSPTQTSSDISKDVEETASYNFSGIQNTSRQGIAIPVCYGEVVTGSIVVSASIRIEDVARSEGDAVGSVFGPFGLG